MSNCIPPSTLQHLAFEIRKVNRDNGFELVFREDWELEGNNRLIPEKVALIHSEVSEALEAYRHNDRENFLEECADAVIRILSLVGGLTDDFDKVLLDKLEVNRGRGHKHGGKRC